MKKQYKTVLTIAGSDPSGGAGIQADIKAISACGCYAASVITALTAQNTLGVTGVHIAPEENVKAQLEAVLSDIRFDAVKLGMIPTAGIADVIAEALAEYGIKNVVLDPVMVATSGDRLVDEAAVGAIVSRLFPLAAVVTPNIPEAEFLTGLKIENKGGFPAAAARLMRLTPGAVLLKAGHFEGETLADVLYPGGREYTHPRIDTPNTHGTGCTLSSAIASFLARGFDVETAAGKAVEYLAGAIRAGADYELGHGHGPVNHFML